MRAPPCFGTFSRPVTRIPPLAPRYRIVGRRAVSYQILARIVRSDELDRSRRREEGTWRLEGAEEVTAVCSV